MSDPWLFTISKKKFCFSLIIISRTIAKRGKSGKIIIKSLDRKTIILKKKTIQNLINS